MKKVVVSGTGMYAPDDVITNEELVASFNQYVHQVNSKHRQMIAEGRFIALEESSAEFILKASGIKRRHVLNKASILDPDIMALRYPERSNEQLSIQCEMAVNAAREALQRANKRSDEIDAVYVACSNMQRPFPAIAIEVQQALGIKGYAIDLNVACASAAFGIQTAVNAIQTNMVKSVLMVNPEICSAQLNFRDRDSHFIFGDACTAVVIEAEENCSISHPFMVASGKLITKFSNNIRSNYGFMNVADPENQANPDKLFVQQGRAVFKEVIPIVTKLIETHLIENKLSASQLKRLWLHQANINMNKLIAEKVLGREATQVEAPIILDEYANTSSAGSIIAFHFNHADLRTGDIGILCGFGAGYSAGSIILQKL